MTKVKSEEIVLGAVFFVITIVSIFFLSYISESYKLHVLSQGFYSGNTKYFKCNISEEAYDSLFTQLNNAIFYAELDINYDIRGILFSGKVEQPDMISGRFLEESDFRQGRKTAVIGQNYKQDLIMKNGRQYVIFGDELFEVVGVMGYSQRSKIDDACFLSLSYEMLENNEQIIFALDSKNQNTVDQTMQLMQAANNQIKRIDRESKDIGRFFKDENISMFLYITFVLFFMTTNIFISLYWIDKRRKEIAIVRLVGFNNQIVFKRIIGRFYAIATISFLFGIALGIFLIKILEFSAILLTNVLVLYCFIMICCTVSTIVPVKKSLNINVITQLR